MNVQPLSPCAPIPISVAESVISSVKKWGDAEDVTDAEEVLVRVVVADGVCDGVGGI